MQTFLILVLVGLAAYWFFSQRSRAASKTDATADDAAGETPGAEGRTPAAPAGSGMACHRGKGLKGLLGMGACCGAPIAAALLLTYFGGSLGSLGSTLGSALPFLALLACPLGMYFMMRFMMPQNQASQAASDVQAASQGETVEADALPEAIGAVPSGEPPLQVEAQEIPSDSSGDARLDGKQDGAPGSPEEEVFSKKTPQAT